ncbi:MAG TPA: type II toxin-antitoxin system RelE/ParE family toxin [Methylomirabilota bacterium]|jgi:mRNA interferase RelE/StbE
MTSPVYHIKWTETAVKLAEAIDDRRTRRIIVERAEALARDPETQGKPLVGELTGFRSVRTVGQRYRIVYRVERKEVVVLIVAIGRRQAGSRSDIYELAKKLLKQGLLRR